MATKVIFHHYLWFEFCEGEFLFCYIIYRTSDAFTFAFEFAIFSHILQEKIIVGFVYIYLPLTF